MDRLNVKRAVFAALIVWTLGVTSFVLSYFVELMEDPDIQANLVLSVALVPITILAAHIYYRKGIETNGILLGAFMFLIAIILDATITVPVLIAPTGGNHLSFFGDPGFWLIGVEYVLVVTIYWKLRKLIGFNQKDIN
ncbi:MAG: DUF5367 family protein [Cytophagia bacterium]|nr:DUF5367 family protein [Cytophagia bacterium]